MFGCCDDRKTAETTANQTYEIAVSVDRQKVVPKSNNVFNLNAEFRIG